MPNYLVVDSVSPDLLRWYIDRSVPSAPKLYLRWSEPVVMVNQSLIVLHLPSSSGSSSSSSLSFPLLPGFVSSSSKENTQIVITLSNYCRETSGSVSLNVAECGGVTLFTALDSTTLYLTMKRGVAVDMAKVANANEEITSRRPLAEGGPGTLSSDLVLHYANMWLLL